MEGDTAVGDSLTSGPAGAAAGGGAASPDGKLFSVAPEVKDRLQQVARSLLDSENGADADGVSEEEIEQLYAEMMSNYEDAVRVFETKFADLPSIARLKQQWRAHKIGEEDPVWLTVETMALYDARAQLILSQVMRVITKGHDLIRVSVARLERLTKALSTATIEAAKYEADVVSARAEVRSLSESLKAYAALQPELLEAMARSKMENDTSSFRAKAQLVGIGAVVAIVGFVLGHMLW